MNWIIWCLFFVLIFTGCASEEEDDDSLIISVLSAETSIPANGASSTTIMIEIHPESTERVVTLVTDSGTFLNETEGRGLTTQVRVDNNGRAFTQLFSGTEVTTATVRASIAQFSDETTVTFHRNYPDSIVMLPNQTQLQADGESSMIIGVLLLSNSGEVSLNTEVQFFANEKGIAKPRGYIIHKAFSVAGGQVSTQLFSTVNYIGTVDVKAKIFNGEDLVTEGMVNVEFVSP